MLLSAVFLALYDICKKASVRDNAVLPTLLFSTIAGCAAFVAVLWAAGCLGAAIDGVSPRMACLSAAKAAIVAASWVFTFIGLRTLPISIATPIRASAPAIVFAASIPVYGEIPSLVQFAGMALVFGGYWVFSWAGKAEGIDFFRDRAVWCAIAGAVLSAASALWDKYILQKEGLPVLPMQLCFQVFLVVAYAALLACTRLPLGAAATRIRHAFEWRWTIPFVGILLAAADNLYFAGLSEDGVPVSVASLMRRFSVVITFVVGAKMFHETNLKRKALALAAILSGVAILGFFR